MTKGLTGETGETREYLAPVSLVAAKDYQSYGKHHVLECKGVTVQRHRRVLDHQRHYLRRVWRRTWAALVIGAMNDPIGVATSAI